MNSASFLIIWPVSFVSWIEYCLMPKHKLSINSGVPTNLIKEHQILTSQAENFSPHTKNAKTIQKGKCTHIKQKNDKFK